jgi:hypothetical protein
MYTADRQCRLCVEGLDPAMCDRAAQNGRMQHPLAHEVGHIFAAPAQEPQILDPLYRGADIAVDEGHGSSPLWYAARASSTAPTIGI